jgi:uncharacterized protein
MPETSISTIASELSLPRSSVQAVAELIGSGATIPFIARYRKEKTGSLDEVAIGQIRDRLEQLAELDKRRTAIRKSLVERELLTPELEQAINGARTLTVLEDLYLPFRPKRRTRATMAREKGLGPLALSVLKQQARAVPRDLALSFVNPEKGISTPEEALAGAGDIIAERICEDPNIRKRMRSLFTADGFLTSTVIKDKEEAGAKFRDYFSWREPIGKAPGHRILAMFRGEREGILSLTLRPDPEPALRRLHRLVAPGTSPCAEEVRTAATDGYKRLLAPSLENEMRADLKARADSEAIRVFADNARELLMAPPLGRRPVMALDPGFRTGAKLVCLNDCGDLVHHTVIYPTHSQKQQTEAAATISKLCARYGIRAIAIGNGTAGRETEQFVRSLELPGEIAVVMVNESGASIYSASKTAREEFPDHDVTVRGAVSIGRRLMDPLAELVKIDPKSIGVGQYQHDVDQAALKKALDDVVVSCVNRVGVELNTAGKELLAHVSGIGPGLAANIVAWRAENGTFKTRRDLLRVKRLGPRAYEQCAGFLRIRDGKNPLDGSGVHPESYGIVQRMAADLNLSVAELLADPEKRRSLDVKQYVTDTVGLPTLTDILAELDRPGRDPRQSFKPFSFAPGISKPADLVPGMRLPGIVTNVTRFGAFVDVGVHQDGLVHISRLADRFVKDPAEVVKVHQQVEVTVLDVDLQRNRISLSMTEKG